MVEATVSVVCHGKAGAVYRVRIGGMEGGTREPEATIGRMAARLGLRPEDVKIRYQGSGMGAPIAVQASA